MVCDRINKLENELHQVMEQLERDGASNSLRDKRRKTLENLWQAYMIEENRWI